MADALQTRPAETGVVARSEYQPLREVIARVEANPERLVEILEEAPLALLAFNAGREILAANARGAALFGYQAAELRAQSIDLLVPARLRQPDPPPMVASHDVVQVDLPGRCKDGGEVLVEWRYGSARAPPGHIFVMEVRDRALLDRAADELRASEERFRLLVDGVRDHALFLLDANGRVSTWNAGAARIKGWTAEEIIGQPYEIFFTQEDRARGTPAELLGRAAREGQVEVNGLRQRKDGTRFWAHAQLTALRRPDGELRGYAKLTRDLTESIRAEESERRLLAERAQREAAEAAEQRIRESERQLIRLQQITAALSGAATPEQIAQVVGEHLGFIGAAACALYSFDGEALRLIGERGYPQDSVTPFSTLPISPGTGRPLADAARTRTPLFFASREEMFARYPDLRAHFEKTAFEGTASMPLIAQGQLLGGLGIRFSRPLEFSEGLRTLLVTVSDLCAQALDRARIFTAEQAARKDAAAKRDQLQTLVDEMPLAVILVDWPSGEVQLANPRASALLHQPVGPNIHQFDGWRGFHADGRQYADAEWPLARALGGETVVGEEMESVLRDGARVWFSVSAAPVTDSAGATTGGLLLFEEVSERKRAEAALRASEERSREMVAALEQAERARHELLEREQRARSDAENANRAKDEFLAMLGHELRNPLAPIVTAIHLMKLRSPDALPKERNVIERQVAHLTRLVDDLLDVSRITRGKIELHLQRIELGEVVARALEMSSPLLEQRQHHVEVSVPARGLPVDADPVRLSQIVANLLTNAAKYTPPGGHISVRAERRSQRVFISVKDDGIGIAPEAMPRIFDLFVQGYQNLDRSEGGLGLGLSIVRNLAMLHGGEVTAHSEGRGRGSEFVVELPAAGAEQRADGQRAEGVAAAKRGRSILVVDDNVDAAELLAEFLRSEGHDAQVAHDGPDALRLAARAHFDAALLDIGLPVMDGYELARRLREGRPALRLIAITGYGQSADRARTREAGFDAHLVKPVQLDILSATLNG